MNPLKHKLANEWMRQDDATPEEALDTWNTMEAEFKLNRAALQEPRTMAQEPRITVAELDNFNTPDLEQTPDSLLKPGETLEDWDVTFRRPNAEGGRTGFKDGHHVDKMKEMEDTLRSNYRKKLLKNLDEGKKTEPFKEYIKTQKEVDLNPGKKELDKAIKEFKKKFIKLGCGMYAGGRVGFKGGSGKCINRAITKLKSGKLNSAEKKIVDAMGDGLKKGGMPKKFWTTALKGEGYFALADFANNLTKGQSLDKSFSNAIETATFGALDIGGNERDLMKYAKERGLDTKDMKEWMDYAQTYGKYAKAHEDQQYAHETLVSDEIVGPDDELLQTSVIEQSPDRIKKIEGQLEEKGKAEGIQSGKGYKDLNEMIEGVVAKEWNKTAGTPLDRGIRKMVGIKGDEGLVWGGIGSMFREGMEKSGFGEHDALKGFKPQTVLNYHPVHGYKEGIKSLIREGDSPMEDMLMFMEKNYPDDLLLQEALRENAKIEEKEDWDQTGWGLKKRKKKVDMGIYDN